VPIYEYDSNWLAKKTVTSQKGAKGLSLTNKQAAQMKQQTSWHSKTASNSYKNPINSA